MQGPSPLSPLEADRLAALREYAILDTAPEAAFERITSLAAHLFGVPIARISFVDETRVWFKASHGTPDDTVPREHSACARVIESDAVFIVPDAKLDPRFRHDPLVVREPSARFYAGAPLRTADGFNLGALCLVDLEPREFDAAQQDSLKQLAAVVVDALATRVTNRRLAAEIRVRQEAEMALVQARAGRTAMLAASFDAIVGLDATGRILELNPAAERLFGYPLAGAAGREMADLLIAPARRDAYRRDTAPLHAGGVGFPLDERMTLPAVRSDGAEFPVEMVLTRVADGGAWTFAAHVRDLSAQHANENRLRMLESSVEHANDAILITEAEPLEEPGPRILYANAAFTRATGYTPEEVIGRTPRLLKGPRTDPAATRKIHDALSRWQPLIVEILNYRKDGSEFWVELNIVPVGDGCGKYTHWVSIQRNITQRKEEQLALVAARDEAERANLAKSEFLSRMSHELRTPLNAILGFGQLLELDPQLTWRQSESVEHVLKGGRHLLGLVDELLDMARIESGRLELTLEAVGVNDLLEEASALLRPMATQRGIRLMPRSAADASDLAVRADRLRFKQVVLNLLSNAIKYNHPGGEVVCTVAAIPAGDRVRLRFRDTGPGIAPEDLSRLFAPFERLHVSDDTVQGTGIGLSISKRLVEAMDGTLSVETAPGEGSTFTVELPAARLAPNERLPWGRFDARGGAAAAGLTAAPADGPTRTVLHVEDNLSNLELVEHLFLKRPDVRLLTTMQGRLGLDLAREHRPDLILLDLHLPDLPGEEVLARLRADPLTRDIPVVILSADATDRRVSFLHELGAADYLTKPLDVRRFFDVLDFHLSGLLIR